MTAPKPLLPCPERPPYDPLACQQDIDDAWLCYYRDYADWWQDVARLAMEYARHGSRQYGICWRMASKTNPCTCGLTELRAAIEGAE